MSRIKLSWSAENPQAALHRAVEVRLLEEFAEFESRA